MWRRKWERRNQILLVYHQIKLWRNYSTNITAVGFERKDPLDDLIAKQKMEKLQKKQGEVRNE
jgi:hypothetical protein